MVRTKMQARKSAGFDPRKPLATFAARKVAGPSGGHYPDTSPAGRVQKRPKPAKKKQPASKRPKTAGKKKKAPAKTAKKAKKTRK
jgi:hypothetical protein